MTAWTDFVKQYAKEKNLSYKESLKQAAPSYKQQKENPCPKGHAVCSCSAEPPTPAVEPPATPKGEKFKISDELAIFINKPLNSIFTQNEIVRFINSYITKNNLNDYPNRAFFLDDKLAKLFNLPNTKSIRFFEYVKKLNHHFFKIKNDSPEVVPPTKKYKKVKLNIIEDEPISRPAIEPPPPQTRELTETKDYKLQFAKKRKRLTKKQQRKKPPSYPPTIIETPLKKRNLIFPTPYRKVKLNIIEDDAVELPKIEPPPTQTRELTETIETTNEPIKSLPPLVSETEEELNKTSIPKLKEMLKELNFTKFAKFKKQDYVDKILELKNIPKGVWWRGKYDFLYNDLKTLYSYLDNTTMFNIEYIKRALLKDINKLEELKKSNLKGEQRRQKYRLIKDQIERFEEFIKEFDKLNNIDFEKEVEKLENEDAERKKRIDKYFEKKESEPTPVVVPLEAAFFNRYKK